MLSVAISFHISWNPGSRTAQKNESLDPLFTSALSFGVDEFLRSTLMPMTSFVLGGAPKDTQHLLRRSLYKYKEAWWFWRSIHVYPTSVYYTAHQKTLPLNTLLVVVAHLTEPQVQFPSRHVEPLDSHAVQHSGEVMLPFANSRSLWYRQHTARRSYAIDFQRRYATGSV
jgi:hypothetical protein